MRAGHNPHKNQQTSLPYVHQVVIPLYIPNQSGYFENSLAIFHLAIASLKKTTHDKTWITVADNGCCEAVRYEVDLLYKKGLIQEVIYTENIGKLNAILKGLAGHNFPLVTIADADVLFLPGWQQETASIFNAFPKAGVVGLVPQIRLWEYCSFNVLWDNFWSKDLRFVHLQDPSAMQKFYDSIGWEQNVNPDYFKYALAIAKNGQRALVGTGHFVATYKRDLFDEVPAHFNFKLGGDSEIFLDQVALKKDYWRLTTPSNLAYHLGNKLMPWMQNMVNDMPQVIYHSTPLSFVSRECLSPFTYFLKNRLFPKLYKVAYSHFLRRWKLPDAVIKTFHLFIR